MPYCIYKLVCDDCDYIYVGSTKSFVHRKSKHKNASKTHKSKVYQMIREYGGWDNWRMVLVEDCDDTIQTKRQAEMREEEFRLKLKATLNKKRAFRTEEEKKEYHKEYNKEYKKDHRETSREYDKRRNQTLHRKEYNKEYKKEYNKEYANRPEVRERRNFLARERHRKKKEELISSDQHSDTSLPCEDSEEI